MTDYIINIFNDRNKGYLRNKIFGIYSVLIIFNVITWIWAFCTFHPYPLLFNTAVLAFTFGLRHAVDADHIAAIDNVTRKLMQEGKQPISVGLFFSLGHSTVVFIASVGVAFTTAAVMHSDLAKWQAIGGVLSTGISAIFLLLI